MTPVRKALVGAAFGAGALAFMAGSASAAVVCSGNVCWHVHEHYDYPAAAGVVVHEDTWKPGPDVVIREHEGRGYWKGETWTAW